jgi:heptosyltransferase-1
VTHAASHRFLIVRLGSLGDVIHGIPVAAALRARFPSGRIDWMVDPRYVELLSHVSGIDAVIPVNPRRGWLSMLSTVRGLRKVRYNATLDLQGLVKSAVLARAVGAWRTIGFPRAHLRERLARLWYTDSPDPGTHPHVVFKNLALLAPLGVRELHPAFPIVVPWSEVFDEVQRQFGPEGYVLLNPGAAWPNKRWPPARFGAVAAAMAESAGLRSLVVWGPGEETLAKAVVKQ